MITRSTRIGNERIVIRSGDHTALQVDWMLGFLREFLARHGGIRDGERIQFGWTMLILRRSGGDILVHAPDFARDPFRDTTEDLTVSLEIQASQNDVLRRLKIEGQAITFQDKIVAAKGVLSEPKVYLERSTNTSAGDSGWYIGPVTKTRGARELEAFYVYQVLRIRPRLVSVLSIPSGFLVVFDGDRIEAVLDRQDIDLWKSSSEGN